MRVPEVLPIAMDMLADDSARALHDGVWQALREYGKESIPHVLTSLANMSFDARYHAFSLLTSLGWTPGDEQLAARRDVGLGMYEQCTSGHHVAPLIEALQCAVEISGEVEKRGRSFDWRRNHERLGCIEFKAVSEHIGSICNALFRIRQTTPDVTESFQPIEKLVYCDLRIARTVPCRASAKLLVRHALEGKVSEWERDALLSMADLSVEATLDYNSRNWERLHDAEALLLLILGGRGRALSAETLNRLANLSGLACAVENGRLEGWKTLSSRGVVVEDEGPTYLYKQAEADCPEIRRIARELLDGVGA
jgi:hypothetical protein